MDDLATAISRLKDIKRRKSMWFRPSVDNAQTFLAGYRGALRAMGVEISAHSEHVVERRGWVQSSIGYTPSMREKGLSEDEIIDELIEILVEELEGIVAGDRRR